MKKSIHFDKVAFFYDDYVDVTSDIDFYLQIIDRYNAKNVLELMCGTGRISISLLKKAIILDAVDYSKEMLKVFKKKLRKADLSATLYHKNICNLDLNKKYDLILLPFQSLSEIIGEKKQFKALKKVHEHLHSNGTFICTLHNPFKRKQAISQTLKLIKEVQYKKNQNLLFWLYESINEETLIVNGFQIFEFYKQSGILKQKKLLRTSFQLIEKEKIEGFIQEIGFKIKNFYGNYDCSSFNKKESPFMIWELSKLAKRD